MRQVLFVITSVIIAFLLQVPQPLQQPSPTPAKSSQDQESHSASIEDSPKGSNQATAVRRTTVSVPPTDDSNHKSSSEWWMLVFTAVIAVAAVIQAIIYGKQASLMHETLAETRKAADAASLSANTAREALVMSERADVIIENVVLSNDNPITVQSEVTVVLKNVGRTKAIDVTVTGYLLSIEHNRSGPQDSAPRIGHRYAVPRVIGPSETVALPFGPLGLSLIEEDEVGKVSRGERRFWIEVSVLYTDNFHGNRRVVGSGVYYGSPDGSIVMSTRFSE